jgi:hypothetical protein
MGAPPRGICRGGICVLGTLLLVAGPRAEAAEALIHQQLSYDVLEGRNLNSFLRSGPVAAHLVLRSGLDPRLLVAFPAGDSGVGLWFAHLHTSVTWKLLQRPQPVIDHDLDGRPLYGIAAKVAIAGGADLPVKKVILSSVRVLRNYQAHGPVPELLAAKTSVQGKMITWARNRLDGAPGYRLSLDVIRGELRDQTIVADRGGGIELEVVASSGESPLQPLPEDQLLNERAKAARDSRNTLTFLSYREKLLAGSWRFNTYFGRDTLMTLELLMPALTPAAIESAFDSVLARLSADGEVAHEEDLGEFAILDHLDADGSRSDSPIFNYNMIDENFMLAPVGRAWLLEDERGRSRAAAFLAREDGHAGAGNTTAGADLVRNLRFVVQCAVAFAEQPRPEHLIGLKPGHVAGQWRDSEHGLGGGRYPYDVNAALVPAALDGAAALYASGLLDPYIQGKDRALFSRAAALASVWHAEAPKLFEVSEPNEGALRAIKAYATRLGIPATAAMKSIGGGTVRFHALALKDDGAPVPVVHSDEGFALLFGRPPPGEVDEALESIMRPFPAGLLTAIGIVVANPVFAPEDVQALLTKRSYHGTVVWSWQQALLAEALDRQLRRPDLPEAIRARIRDALVRLWHVIGAGRAVRNSELWSWAYRTGRFHVAAFGASNADADESNAAQLWSTVYLAIWPPRPGSSRAIPVTLASPGANRVEAP